MSVRRGREGITIFINVRLKLYKFYLEMRQVKMICVWKGNLLVGVQQLNPSWGEGTTSAIYVNREYVWSIHMEGNIASLFLCQYELW